MILKFLGIGGAAGLAVSLALGLLLILQAGETRHWKKQSGQYQQLAADYKAQLDAISTAKNTQQIVTRDRIVTVTKTIHDAEGNAKKVESAPIAPTACHGVTPPAVMQSDV